MLRTPEVKARAITAIQALPIDPPFELEIAPFKTKRSREQNNLQWRILAEISNYITDAEGVRRSRHVWNEHLKCEFGFIAGTRPFEHEGLTLDIPVAKSSAQFTVSETSDYIEQLLMFAAENGVLVDL